ncbi:PilZ domain-containing protein [Cellvibrio sp. KY-GH-1]|uniref:PilZ domain-containing protein n=1 Tax=Cellvibrio sp. KY-GH-1 TaxID=2303332 RepID=UPI001244CCF5|nr:PilZ domain-containing protein [Cellvibrio sp. KY-GH-1]QEY19191.1 PilZ domain-containing protein [Cellvibrio sp. KY-GH-1]
MTSTKKTQSAQERRKFSRILFDAHVELAQGDCHWRASLLDISLKGLLIQQQLPAEVKKDAPILVKILLSDQTSIAMSVSVAHQHHNQTGLMCTTIDIDSVSHLRRLIELNLGDATAAERELNELMSDY